MPSGLLRGSSFSVQARSANFKARINSALDSKSKTLTILTVEPQLSENAQLDVIRYWLFVI